MKEFLDVNKKSREFYKNNKKEKWRLNYHFEPPFGLINDPNGLSFYNNEYYIYFQWNPFGVVHKNKCWGLIKTKNFINYTIPELVLAPTEHFNKDGVYSGSALEVNGKLNLIYTGNVKNKDNLRTPYQCVVECDKEGKLEKEKVIIKSVPKGYTTHFRDPKVFKKDNIYYFVIGAQNDNLKGRALLYSSKDFENWNLEGEIKTKYNDFGYMWECPNLINIKGKDIFIFSPQGLEKEEFKYQNIYQSGYILGNFDYKTLNFNHNEFEELDYGTDFYAPQVFKDDKGRNILIGWMGLPEEENNHPVAKKGWVHALTMPRELELKEDKIYQKPLEEFKNLRKEVLEEVKDLKEKLWKSSNIRENSYEMYIFFKRNETGKLKINMASSEEEEVSLTLDFNKKIGIFKNNLKEGLKQVRKLKIEDIKDLSSIKIYMDTSACEIYINDGRYVLSNRIYPMNESVNVEVIQENVDIKELKVWKLGGFNYE